MSLLLAYLTKPISNIMYVFINIQLIRSKTASVFDLGFAKKGLQDSLQISPRATHHCVAGSLLSTSASRFSAYRGWIQREAQSLCQTAYKNIPTPIYRAYTFRLIGKYNHELAPWRNGDYIFSTVDKCWRESAYKNVNTALILSSNTTVSYIYIYIYILQH